MGREAAGYLPKWEKYLSSILLVMMDPKDSIQSRQSTGSDTDYLISGSYSMTDDSLLAADYRNTSSYGAVEQIKQSNTVITLSEFDQFSVHTTCPSCNRETDTRLKHHTGSATFKCFLLLVILTCGLLAWLAFFMKDFKDVEHVCQHCGQTIGTYKRRFISR